MSPQGEGFPAGYSHRRGKKTNTCNKVNVLEGVGTTQGLCTSRRWVGEHRRWVPPRWPWGSAPQEVCGGKTGHG